MQPTGAPSSAPHARSASSAETARPPSARQPTRRAAKALRARNCCVSAPGVMPLMPASTCGARRDVKALNTLNLSSVALTRSTQKPEHWPCAAGLAAA